MQSCGAELLPLGKCLRKSSAAIELLWETPRKPRRSAFSGASIRFEIKLFPKAEKRNMSVRSGANLHDANKRHVE